MSPEIKVDHWTISIGFVWFNWAVNMKDCTYGDQKVGVEESVKVKGLVANVVDTKLGFDRLCSQLDRILQ
jgi:hypothetical protein